MRFIFIWEENSHGNDDKFSLVEENNKTGIIFKVISNIEVLKVGIKETGDWIIQEEATSSKYNEPMM